TGVRIIAFGPAAESLQILYGRRYGKERSRGVQRRRIEGAPRRDVVDDPDAAAMRREHEVRRPRMDDEIAHGHGRKVAALVLRPAAAAVDADPQAELRPEVQQAAIDRI